MSEPATAERLNVFLHGEPVGQLDWRGPNRYRFAYSEAVRRSNPDGSLVLSASLPVQAEPFAPAGARPFFEGLLPEGAARASVAKSLGLSEDNGYGLLAAIGAECAGAVAVLPPGEIPPPPGGGSVKWLDDAELARLVADLPRHPLGIDPEEGIRLSLGGVQEKLVLARAPSGAFGRPADGAPSTHVLKPGHADYKDLVANEAFCLAVARRAGLPAARVEIVQVAERPCLVVERFDRALDDAGRIVRLHQEDACQALGLMPSAKYELEGGPSLADLVALVRELSGPHAAADINILVRAALLNFLLGNNDAHGKNFALLYEPDVRLAPLYDVVSTSAYPGLTSRLAMRIGGAEREEDVDLSAWTRFAGEAGLGRALVRQVGEQAARMLACARETRDSAAAEGWHRPVIDRIVEVAERHAGQLRQ